MHLYSVLAIVLVASRSSLADSPGQITNLDLGPEVALQHGCNVTCQLLLEYTNRVDLAMVGTSFDMEFYATASNFNSSSPGDILKMESFDASNLGIPTTIKTYRFQYTSIDVNGSLAPSSGFLALPRPNPNDTEVKLNLIAWAHSTIGLHRGCVPSSARGFWALDAFGPLLAEGYAVVATDYVGLGTNHTSHKYLSLADHANDIYYSVQAIRKVFPDLFNVKWMSIGHSQGGGAVWKLSEHPLVQDSRSGYVGTVAIAPAVNALDLATTAYGKILPGTSSDELFAKAETPLLLMGIKAAVPEYQMPWAAQALKERIQYANAAQSCLYATVGLTIDLTDKQLIASGAVTPMNDDVLKEWTRQHAATQGALASMPLLVIQGLNDTAIPPDCTRRAYESASRVNRVRLEEFPRLGHFDIIDALKPTLLEFMRDRFSDKPTNLELSSHIIHADDSTIIRSSLDVDKPSVSNFSGDVLQVWQLFSRLSEIRRSRTSHT